VSILVSFDPKITHLVSHLLRSQRARGERTGWESNLGRDCQEVHLNCAAAIRHLMGREENALLMSSSLGASLA
jgi:hypothetical protein